MAWGKLIDMKNYVEGKIQGELDNALEALMCLFSDHKSATSDDDIAEVAHKFKKVAGQIVAAMDEAEKATIKDLPNTQPSMEKLIPKTRRR
jgi:hypothetical protein